MFDYMLKVNIIAKSFTNSLTDMFFIWNENEINLHWLRFVIIQPLALRIVFEECDLRFVTFGHDIT